MSTTTALPAILRAPRIPKDCPVSIVHLWRPDYGRHHLYEIHDQAGALVEVLSGDENISERLFARYPWTSTQLAPAFGVIHRVWPVYDGQINATEYRERVKREPWSPHAPAIVKMADRCEKHAAVVRALQRVRIDGIGDGPHPDDGPRTAIIYQRDRAHAGDDVSVHLRRAMDAAERAGLVERVYSAPANMENTFRRYRATDTTPYRLGE